MDVTRLLELLEGDARLSHAELATMLGVSRKEVESAVAGLKERGVVKGYRTVIDWRKAEARKAVAIIQVKVVPQQRLGFDKVCSQIGKDDRVTDLFVTSGEYDLMVTMRADNIDEISEFVTERLAPMKEVTGTYTHIILKEFKRDGALFHDDKNRRLPVS